MAGIWLTKAGNLGIFPNEEYFEYQLDAYDPLAGPLTYTIITGSLPQGLELTSSGLIKGIPINDTVSVISNITLTKDFVVRITTTGLAVTDRAFSISVSGLLPPVMSPTSSSLGSYVSGDYIDIQLTAAEQVDTLTVTFSVIQGSLPPGLSLSSSGQITGYVTPVPNDQTAAITGFDKTAWDQYLLDFTGINTSKNYQFTIKADDGINFDQEIYSIYIYDRYSMTADNDIVTADNEITAITADISNKYDPILYTPSGTIGTIRADNNFAFGFDAVDFDDDALTYSLASGSLPTGLSLNSSTGYITGLVPNATLNYQDFNFSVVVSKTLYPEYVSQTISYTIRVLGTLNDTVTWITPSDLGLIYAGQISELAIQAQTKVGRAIFYKLKQDSVGALPSGLALQSNGIISGRPSFNSLNPEGSGKYTFTVVAYDSQGVEYDQRTFTLTVFKRTAAPYENLYISLLPNRSQRAIYDNIVSNTDIIPENFLYRPTDPWFGRNTNRQSLFMYGLNSETLSDYINSMTLNHYWKTLTFGDIKTAVALDDNFDVKYEVVYVEILDNGVNANGLGPNLSITWPENNYNISTVYPNSFPNMEARLESGIGYLDKGVLPNWMTSRQPDGYVLGFTRAIVLCYTLPGKSTEVSYRISQVAQSLNLIDFVIDRYEWDNILSEYYDPSTSQFIANNYVLATGNITANTSSNLIVGTSGNISGTGTISGTAGNVYIIGTLTEFTQELTAGKNIYVSGSSIGIVNRIFSNANIRLENPLSSTITSVAFETEGTSTLFNAEIKLGDRLVVSNVVLGNVATILSNTQLRLTANSSANVSDQAFSHLAQDPYTVPTQGQSYLKFPQVDILS